MLRLARWIPWLVCLAIGVLLGLGSYTFQYAQGLSYLSNKPEACMNCHIMREHYDSWTKSSHRMAATCNDCHVPHTLPEKYLVKFDNGWHHSKAFTLQNFREPIRIRPANLNTLQHNCVHCHAVAVSEIAGHRDIELGQARCTDCHRSVGHLSLD